jgi:hypothetical protein
VAEGRPAGERLNAVRAGIPVDGAVLLHLVANQLSASALGAQSGGPPPTRSAYSRRVWPDGQRGSRRYAIKDTVR